MLDSPFAVPSNFKKGIKPEGEKETRWVIFSGDHLLLESNGKSFPKDPSIPLKRQLYLGTFDDRHLFAGEIEERHEAPQGMVWEHLRKLHGIISDANFALAGCAKQLLNWDRVHAFCGCCGKETVPLETERCRKCSACGHLFYPKITPAIIVLVKKEDKILLAHGAHFPEKFYSVLAGFVDPGETLEQCVMREVFEEVGIKVKNIQYLGSQPWPFPNSLMIGFTCDWQEGEIKIDPQELTEAGWYDESNLPQLPPHLSIARMLIDSHFKKVI